MRRAALGALLGLTICAPAFADCADEVRAAQARMVQVTDARHRQELTLLFDKAAKDAAAGRERLCLDAVVRAQALYPISKPTSSP